MSIRILHCGKSIINYNICINNKIAGFRQKNVKSGDIVYISVIVDKASYCGARAKIGENIEFTNWDELEGSFLHVNKLEDIEYCIPFNLNILKETGGRYYGVKYLQGAKAISDIKATKLLKINFEKNISNSSSALFNI